MAKTTKKSEKTSITCPICLEPIKDAIGNRKGEDSIYCDGLCDSWVHRSAGLSKQAFEAARNAGPNSCFYCPHCHLDSQQKEILLLKSAVESLKSTVEELSKSTESSSNSNVSSSYSSVVSRSVAPQFSPGVQQPPSQNKISSGRPLKPRFGHDHDRKFKLVVTKLSIRDCYRLGHYN